MRPADFATEPAAALGAVLTPAFLRTLDRLHLRVQHSLSSRPGNTPMPRGAQAAGVELESHKAYDSGDDLRHLDWNAYGRLDQLLIKRYRAEREAALHVFVDISRSMAFPPTDGKLAFAYGLALTLAYISARNHDPARIVALGGTQAPWYAASGFVRHRDAIPILRQFLLRLTCAGETALATGLDAAVRDQRSPGIAVVISDFLVDASVYEVALARLVARKFTVAAIRVIGPGERNPAAAFRHGEVIDAETGRTRFVSLTPTNIAAYTVALQRHLRGLAEFCRARRIVFATADTAAGLEATVFRDLPSLGLLR